MKKLMMMMAACAMIMACGNDDEEVETATDRHYYGFFSANVNGDSIYIPDTNEYSERFGGHWSSNTEDETMAIFWGVRFNLPSLTNAACRLTLSIQDPFTRYYPLQEKAGAGWQGSRYPTGISFSLLDDKWNDVIYYTPLPEKAPFNMYITKIWLDQHNPSPIIEGNLDGVLYNSENPNDSIIIKNAKFGMY